MFEKGGYAGMIFRYRGPDTRNRMVVPSGSTVRFVPGNGFKEQVYYIGGMLRVPNLNRNPAMSRIVPHVVYGNTLARWPGIGRSDNFACRWTGSLRIHNRGRYRFQLTSDDGSKLYVQNRFLVNNDGLHGLWSRWGDMHMDPGLNQVRVEFFERGGWAGMVFYYMGRDTGNRMQHVPKRIMTVAY